MSRYTIVLSASYFDCSHSVSAPRRSAHTLAYAALCDRIFFGIFRNNPVIVFVSDIIITETGSIRGTLEASSVEINGHLEGRITADAIIVGKNAVIKGDIFFKNTLKTEEGADIDGYIKRINNGKSDTEEDIAIEEIVERKENIKPKVIPAIQHKEAV